MIDDKDFLEEMNSRLFVNSKLNVVKFDFEWVDIFEEVMPYIDNILRNPKRFIVNEEEIVKVELARKITVESVIHLTQHTNLIQDIDDNGDVHPSKILNINKEESFDTYENRFIYTLINNMNYFYNVRMGEGIGDSFIDNKCDFSFEGTSQVGDLVYNLNISFSNREKKILDEAKNKKEATIEDRIKRIKRDLDGFTCTELYNTLDRLHVPAVRSPIRKTNVILKNPNFQQATKLWNYIQSYSGSGVERKKEKKSYINNGKLKKKYDQVFRDIYDFTVMDSISHTSKREAVTRNINNMIDNIYNIDGSISEADLKKIFNNSLKTYKSRNNRKKDEVISIINSSIDNSMKTINDAFMILK